MAATANRITERDIEDFRRAMKRATDWLIEYFEHPERYPVLSQVAPGKVRNSFPPEPPQNGRPLQELLDDFERKILPGVTHWNHPSFFAYFAISGSLPGILGEFLCAALNVNGMVWKTCPSLTEMEELSLDYLRSMLGLKKGFFGMILDTASTSSLLAEAAAREALADLAIRDKGMAGRADVPVLTLYTSSEAHSSVEKAAIVLGIGRENVRRIPVDEEFRMRVNELELAIREDISMGKRPFCVVATVGTTSTTSVDPVPEIGAVCRRYRLWLHVDAAYAGMAAILEPMRGVLSGCNEADSIVVNPHKWLATQIDLSAFYCKRPDILRRAFSIVPEYLRTSQELEVTDLMDYGFQLGRRFRALKLWMVMSNYGVEGLREMIAEHIRLAGLLKGLLEKSEFFEIAAPVPFSTVCFRLSKEAIRAGSGNLDEEKQDSLNQRLLDEVNATGRAYLSHTRIGGRLTLRCAIGNQRTKEPHVRALYELLQAKAREIVG